jgi:hypothetical protein
MSRTKKDRKLQSKSGKSFPSDIGQTAMQAYAEAIAAALKADFGGEASTVKVVSRLTATNERAVRNWLEARNAPSGANLMILVRHSDAVLEAVLDLSGRRSLLATGALLGLRDQLREIVEAMDGLEQ